MSFVCKRKDNHIIPKNCFPVEKVYESTGQQVNESTGQQVNEATGQRGDSSKNRNSKF